MNERSRRAWLEELESRLQHGIGIAELAATLAFVAGTEVALDPDELHAARRRALLLLAAGGDPQRELEPDGRAVTALAGELDDRARRNQLTSALVALQAEARGLELVQAALSSLVADPERAWRLLACGLLAEALAGD